MPQHVYKTYISSYTSAWHALSTEEQRDVMAQVHAAFVAAGGYDLIHGDAMAAASGWQLFGVERFPDLAAAEHYRDQLVALGWHRYVREIAVLGTERALDVPWWNIGD
jgi:S-methylmethionine-dependent homocysteine/selenocysteine methylase